MCCSNKHLRLYRAVSSFISAWLTWVRVSQTQPDSAAVLLQPGPARTSHTTELLTPVTACEQQHETSDFILELSRVSFCVWVFGCTWFDSGLYIWLTVICFVSWWWGPVIDGWGPGHLRSTAVDSSEIESSSWSVTMSSLRSWLGRQPSKPQHCWDFMNFNWGHKCECTRKLCWVWGKGSEHGI